jgi:pyruvate carboxylase
MVNGHEKSLGMAVGVPVSQANPTVPITFAQPKTPPQNKNLHQPANSLRSLRQVYLSEGPTGFVKAVRNNKGLLVTDTTWRDAHQSLLATRIRSKDLLQIAPATAAALAKAFSLEMWGGATFDVSMRFLSELLISIQPHYIHSK